jgi:hypothetical protein
LKKWSRRGDKLDRANRRSVKFLGDDQGSGSRRGSHYLVVVRRRDCPNVRNLLTVPSGGGAKGLKTTKLMIVDAVGEEDEEPQGEGRG